MANVSDRCFQTFINEYMETSSKNILCVTHDHICLSNSRILWCMFLFNFCYCFCALKEMEISSVKTLFQDGF